MSELLDRLREHNLAVVEIHTGVQLSDSLAVYLLTGERLQPAQTPAPDFPIKPKPETNDLVTLDETRLIELSNAGNEATCAEVEALAFHALHVHAQGALVQKVCAELARRASPQGERDETLALAAANLATQKWLETTPSYAYQTEVLKRLRAASPPPETPEKP